MSNLSLPQTKLSAALAAAILLAGVSGISCAADIAWVWHSSEAPQSMPEIAVLLDHLNLSGDVIEARQRRRMLAVDHQVRVTPVVHVQSDVARMPRLGERQTSAIIQAVKTAGGRSTSGWVQLDFEAVDSQRSYYFDLVSKLRQQLPPATKLSVTILASWCELHSGLDKLAADEVVPMFFRMGAASDIYRQRLLYTPEQLDPRCRQQAAGFAVQEAPPQLVQQRYARRYWFNFKNWDGFSKGE